MSITSPSFLLFIIMVIFVYYIVPKRFQWVWLLIASSFFYLQTGINCAIYIVVTAASTYIATRGMEILRNKQTQYLSDHKESITREEKKAIKQQCNRRRKTIMIITLVANFMILCTFKYLNFILEQVAGMISLFQSGGYVSLSIELIVPLGISFYTFQTMGYLIDAYWEKTEVEHNFGKILLFTSFFPQITQGPISNFEQLKKDLFGSHKFSYQRYSYGCQRMIWGFFKKMVIADLLSPFVKELFANYIDYSGISVLIGIFMYSVQIYADFSGYMDIMCGLCEVLGIHMTENFDRPYFSKSVAEYWRRWHISLGAWFKSYIYYPIAMAKWNRNLGKKLDKICGGKVGKNMPATIALLATWFTTGLWHGANWGYIIWGLVNGMFIIFSLWMEPIYEKVIKKCKINIYKKSWTIFQVLRTFILVSFIKILPEVGTLKDGLGLWKQALTNHIVPISLTELIPGYSGVSELLNLVIILLGVCLLFGSSVLQRKQKLRDWIEERPKFIRWGFYIMLVLIILVFGTGSAKENFMYAQF